MSKALLVYADGSEDLEITAPADILTRSGVEVVRAAICPSGTKVTLAHGTTVECDVNIADAKGPFDAIVIPGGLPGAYNCRDSAKLLELLKEQKAAGRYICAICASPGFVLAHHGFITDNDKATGYPGCTDNIKNCTGEGVVIDEQAKLVTGKGPAFACDFGFAIAQVLTDDKTVAGVKKGMLFE